jgi:hypothetical protein
VHPVTTNLAYFHSDPGYDSDSPSEDDTDDLINGPPPPPPVPPTSSTTRFVSLRGWSTASPIVQDYEKKLHTIPLKLKWRNRNTQPEPLPHNINQQEKGWTGRRFSDSGITMGGFDRPSDGGDDYREKEHYMWGNGFELAVDAPAYLEASFDLDSRHNDAGNNFCACCSGEINHLPKEYQEKLWEIYSEVFRIFNLTDHLPGAIRDLDSLSNQWQNTPSNCAATPCKEV